MSNLPYQVTSTVIDGVDLGFPPTEINLNHISHRSLFTGALGTAHIGWTGLEHAAEITLSYERLTKSQANRLLLVTTGFHKRGATEVRFNPVNTRGGNYSTRKLRVSLTSGTAPDTFSCTVSFSANLVLI